MEEKLEQPIVSIIMPIYNAEDTLDEALKSVCAQEFSALEIILIDDGSTDKSLDICKRYQENDKRIVILQQGNMGSGAARNSGLAKATGEYIYFPDADDVLHPQAIEIMVAAMQKSKADIVVFGYQTIIRKTGKTTVSACTQAQYKAEQFRADFTAFTASKDCKILGSAWNKCFRMDKIKQYGLIFPNIARNEEEIFIMRYMDVAESIYSIEDVLYDFYPIDLENSWKKLPDNYCEIVEQFKTERLDFMQKWNSEQAAGKEFIYTEYYGKMYLGLRLCFSPYKEWSFGKRYNELRQRTHQLVAGMDKDVPAKIANSTVYKLMKGKHYLLLYFKLKK